MITMPDLQTSLLDLLHHIENTDIKLIVGGGFGIYLKINHIQRLGIRTLLRERRDLRPHLRVLADRGRTIPRLY